MEVKKVMIVGLAALSMTACMYRHVPQINEITEARIGETDHCKLLGKVQGESYYSFTALGIDIAKDQAKMQAYELGATHVMWTQVDPTLFPLAMGRAYKCNVKMSKVDGKHR